MNQHFVVRKACPCCGFKDSWELCRESYSQNPIHDYLESFYSPQGRVELGYLDGQDFILVECRGCGLVFQQEIPNAFLMGKIYEEWIDPAKVFALKETRRDAAYFSKLSSEILRVISHFDEPPSRLRFLDFSMGWGNWCRVAQSFGCQVHGTEFSSARKQYAHKAGIEVIDPGEISRYKYDFINTEQVFEHLPDPRKTLFEIKQSLKPHGILKISVPDGSDILRRLKVWNWKAPKGSHESLNCIAPLEHVNCFNNTALIKLAATAGLSPVQVGTPSRSKSSRRNVKEMLRSYYRFLKENFSSDGGNGDGTYLFFGLN